MGGAAGGGPVELGVEPVELGQPVAARLVADGVGQPGEAVDGQQVGAVAPGQQAGGDGEVLAPRPAHHGGG